MLNVAVLDARGCGRIPLQVHRELAVFWALFEIPLGAILAVNGARNCPDAAWPLSNRSLRQLAPTIDHPTSPITALLYQLSLLIRSVARRVLQEAPDILETNKQYRSLKVHKTNQPTVSFQCL